MEKIKGMKNFYSSFLKNKKGGLQRGVAKTNAFLKEDAAKKEIDSLNRQKENLEVRNQQQMSQPSGSKWKTAAAGVGGFFAGGLAFGGKVGIGRILLWVFAIVVHLLDATTKFSTLGQTTRLILYLVLAMWAWFEYVGTRWDPKLFGTFLLLLTLSWGIPWINYIIVKYLSSVPVIAETFSFLIVFTPAWPIFIGVTSRENKVVGTLTYIYIVFWFSLFIYWYFTSINNTLLENIPLTSVDPYEPVRDLGKLLKDFWRNGLLVAVEKLKEVPTLVQQTWNQSMNYATGGYYQGQEENVQEPFGVFLRDTKPIQEKYYYGEPVTVLADLEAKNIGKDPIDVEVKCYAQDMYQEGPSLNADQLYPQQSFKMEGNEKEQIDCTFLNNNKDTAMIGGAEYDVILNVTFTFQTDARLKVYWMNYDRYKTLISQGEDSLSKLEIPEEEEFAIYTSGPVKVGIGVGQPPIKVDGPIKPRLGITLESNWDRGKIVEIKSLNIYIPNQLTLDLKSCSAKIKEKGIESEFRVYELNEPIAVTEDYRTITCRFDSVPNTILDSTPVTIRYIKAKVEYTYLIDDTVTVEIIETPPDEQTAEVSETAALCGNSLLDEGEWCDESYDNYCHLPDGKSVQPCVNCACTGKIIVV